MGTKTALSAEDDIFNRLVEAGVKQAASLTGGIYPMVYPKDSTLEDIVVGTLSMNAEQLQEGIFNVNILVPNLNLSGDSTIPNRPRLKDIMDIVTPVLENYRGFDFGFDIRVPGQPYRDGNRWFINIQVEYYTLRKQN